MLTQFFLQFALVGAEWVLWVLVLLSLASVIVMIERYVFYRRRTVDIDALRLSLTTSLEKGEFREACLLYTSPSPRDATLSRMPSSA